MSCDCQGDINVNVATCQIGVPESDDTSEGEFPHEEVVHPAEGELDVLHSVGRQVGR